MDNYFNLDTLIDMSQVTFASPSVTPASSRGKSLAAPEFQVPNPSAAYIQPQAISAQTFAGPSHQYDLHKQQTSLPSGALANSFDAVPRSRYPYGGLPQNFGASSSSGLFDPNFQDDIFDFPMIPSQSTSFGQSDIDMELGSPMDEFSSQNGTGFCIDPQEIGGMGDESPVMPPAPPVRLFPGAHQQAELAKQQQQQEIQRQRQMRNAQPSQQTQHKRNTSSGNSVPLDPFSERIIANVLHNKRHNSNASASEGAQTPQSSALSALQLARSKKEEEDMDDDERLLASEEGKKLSSKERRQLRNKVSARAFRARRKGKLIIVSHSSQG